MKSKILKKEFIVASPIGKAEPILAEEFWKIAFDSDHPNNNAEMGYLVSQFSFAEDWDSWELHPNGDEIVFCTMGEIRLVLEQKEHPVEIDLKPGEYAVVPKNTWHTAKVNEKASALFVTWGHGTKHRKIEQ